MDLSLYVHPDSGGYWEAECKARCGQCGWEEVPGWRSVPWNEEEKAMDKKSAKGKLNFVKVGEAMSKVKESCNSVKSVDGRSISMKMRERCLQYIIQKILE